MNTRTLWTASRARLQWVRNKKGANWNWIFLPGGPGLGSESLLPLINILDLPGTLWRLDLPGDGSNIERNAMIRHWPQALLEVADTFENIIMIGHSRGGMFLLSLSELEKKIKGLILLDSAPDNSWQEEFASRITHTNLPEEEDYKNHPSNETLRRFVLAGAPCMFTKKGLAKGLHSLENLPYNQDAIQWTQKHFDPTYSAKWIPKTIPTLILSGSDDLATPLKLFSQRSEYHRGNISLVEIENAGHFPWIENPSAVAAAFNDYINKWGEDLS